MGPTVGDPLQSLYKTSQVLEQSQKKYATTTVYVICYMSILSVLAIFVFDHAYRCLIYILSKKLDTPGHE